MLCICPWTFSFYVFFCQAEDGIRDPLDWSSDVCSSDLHIRTIPGGNATARGLLTPKTVPLWAEGRNRVVEGVHGERAAAERPAGAGEPQRDLQDEVGALAGLGENVIVRRNLALDIGEDVIG